MFEINLQTAQKPYGAVVLSLLLFVWFTGLFWQFMGFDLLVRFVESVLILFIFLVLGKTWFRSARAEIFFVCISVLFSLVVLAFLRDRIATYGNVLYLKTAFYLWFAIFLGLAVNQYIMLSAARQSLFVSCFGWGAVLLIGFIFVLALKESWAPGRVLLGSYIGDAYQGVSRVIALCILFAVLLRRSLPSLILVPGVLVGLLLLLSLNSFGAFFAVALAVGVLLKDAVFDGKVFLGYFIASLIVAGLCFLYFGGVEQLFNEKFWIRFYGKFDVEEAGDQSRFALITKGFELWLNNPDSLLFGVGPMNYACAVGYCDEYRHPHNLIADLLVWFGVFGILVFGYIFYVLIIAAKLYLSPGCVFENFVGALFLNSFFLAMVGGDLEQNRHLIFMIAFVHAFWLNRQFSSRG